MSLADEDDGCDDTGGFDDGFQEGYDHAMEDIERPEQHAKRLVKEYSEIDLGRFIDVLNSELRLSYPDLVFKK